MKHDAADLVIVGGGIIGTAIAYYAAKTGMKVVLAERGEIAGGTSSRCDGNILAIDKEPGFDSRMSLVSQELVAELARELEDEFEYRAPGSILVCENDQEMQAAEQWVARQQQEGLPFRMLDQQDLREEWPHLAKDLPGGLECATDSTVNPVLMTYALAGAARRMGARLLPRTPIQSVLKDEGGTSAGWRRPMALSMQVQWYWRQVCGHAASVIHSVWTFRSCRAKDIYWCLPECLPLGTAR